MYPTKRTALAKRSQQLKRKSRCPRRSTGFETLEQRCLLAGLSSPASESPVPAWFADYSAALINPSPTAKPQNAPAAPFVGPREVVETQWVARLNSNLVSQIGSLGDIDRLLSTSDVEVHAERGLGLTGLVQLRTLSSDLDVALRLFQTTSGIVAYSRNFEFIGNAQPNDADFGNQTHLESSGQFGTLIDADVDATSAWDTSTGSTQIVVGVIDSGVDLAHPDLYLNIWINQGEIGSEKRGQLRDIDSDGLITFYDLNDATNAGLVTDVNRSGYIDARDLLADPRWTDGVDTDHNGFVDDFFGWNFREALDEPFDPNDPSDASGHGTHVAGIIGATGNNGIGVTGLNWRSSLMSLKFLDQNNQGDVASAIAAVNYATMMRNEFTTNVRVLNNSWGQAGSFNSALSDALTAAQNADILIVAAAGNGNVLGVGVDNDRTPFYPASYPLENLISVAASDGQDRLAAFSNFGATSVDLAAPGVGIRSTLPGGRYGEANGTSMATPLVTGTAALIWAALPQASASEVREAILSTVDITSGLQTVTTFGGRLNAAKALASNTFAPTAVLLGADDIVTDGSRSQEITVRFNDRTGVDLSSLGDDDLQVVHDWGEHETYAVHLRPSSLVINPAGTEIQATYQLTPPGGTWDPLDFGDYQIEFVAGAIRSLDGSHSNRDDILGQFRVQLSAPDVIYVDSFQDDDGSTTLRNAIETANKNPERSFTLFLDTGTYRLDRPYVADSSFLFNTSNVPLTCSTGAPDWSNGQTGDLDVFGQVTVIGDSSARTVIQNQTGDRSFKVHPSGSLTLKRLALTGGNAPAGQSGGAILSVGNVQLSQVELRGNSAIGTGITPGRGGGVAAWSGNVSVTQSRLTENQADFGGAILACGNAQLTVSQSTIDNNHGGGILSHSSVDGTIDSSTIANNFDGAVSASARDYPGGNGSSASPRISLDGRTISFLSEATNLVAGDTNTARDAYLFDRTQQTLHMLSVNSSGQAARSPIDGLVLSGDGQHAAFLTQANNLVSGDNLLSNDVFVRDVNDATTSLISTGPTGRASRGTPALSDDGRFIAYQQTVTGDPFNIWGVYVRDRQLGTTQRLNLSMGSSVANISFLDQTSISGDGRYVVLSSRASGTADGFFHEIYLIDRVDQAVESLPARPLIATPNGSLYSAAINGDGHFITFASDDTNLVAGDTNGMPDIFVYDTNSHSTRRVSQTSAGAQANGTSQAPSISSDGRYVAFSSLASNLTTSDQNALSDVFIVDLSSTAIERVSVADTGTDANGSSGSPSLSGDGRYVAYESSATNIVRVHANHQPDLVESRTQIYVRDRLVNLNESVSAFELPSTLRITNSTLAYNTGSSTLAGNVTVHNSLLAGNLVGFDFGARSASAGFNIYASAAQEVKLQASDSANNSSALKLGPLTAFEGFPPAYPLLQGNPAIDAGASQAIGTLDQWNQLRVRPDVGALETRHGSIDGQVFADLNGNRLRDVDEPGLSGEQVFVDENNDGIRQAHERSLTTAHDNSSPGDQTGQYSLEHLAPGPIIVRSVVSDQWAATALLTTRVTSGSVQGNGASTTAILSPTGKTLAFLSAATNFVANDDARPSIFVYSRVSNSVEKIPVEGAGLQVLDIAGTEDQFVLLRNDTGVYVWDRQQQLLRAVSVSNSGQLANAHSDHASMSNDGRWIALSSFANNLVAGDTDTFADVFLVDRELGSIVSLTQRTSGFQGNNDSETPSISADGQTIAFVSDANNLVAGDSNGLGDIFVFEQATHSIRRVNISTGGAQSNGFTYPPQISGNGRFVVFQSLASNLVSGDQTATSDLFVVDLQTTSIERLDIPWLTISQLVSVNPSISYDGQYVTFEANSSQLNHVDADTQRNIFVYDRYWNSSTRSPRLKLVSRNSTGPEATGESRNAIISQDGQWVAFQSTASDYVPADTNAVSDIFIATNPFEDLSRRVNLDVGQAIRELDFALEPLPGAIAGTLFNDLSQDEVYDLGDPTLTGWTIFLDANSNGRRDVAESYVVSQANGNYQFANVPAYREHVIAVEVPSGWEQVAPERANGQPRLFLPAGGNISGRNFGFRLKPAIGQSDNARIEGRVFNDADNNGVQDAGENSVGGMEVYLDLNGNERRDFGEPRTVTDSQGAYNFTSLGSRSYSVRIAPDEGTLLTSPLGNRFTQSDQTLASGSVTLSKPQDVTLADFDGLNGLDVAVALYSGNSVVLQLNNGLGGFSSTPVAISIAPNGLGPISVASGNLNRLGHADLVLANSLNNTLSVLLDFNGTGFTQQRTITVGAMPLDVAMADIDDDGDNDLIAAVQTSTFAGQLRLFINDGTGQFAAGAVLGTGGKRAVSVATADLNRDNVLDFVVANQGDFGRNGDSGNVGVLFGRANGTYAAAVTYIVGSTPLDIAIADLNGDNNLDLVAVNFALNTVSILRGDGSGGLQLHNEQFSVGQGPVQVKLLDIEGDRDTDILVTNLTSRNVSILRNRQASASADSISFEPAESFGVAEFSVGARLSFAAADLDGSGTVDLALINSETNSLKVLKNSLVAGAHRMQLNGTGTSTDQNFGVRFETLLPKLDPLVGPVSLLEDSAPLTISLTGIARGRSSGPPLRLTATSNSTNLFAPLTIQYVEGSSVGQLRLAPQPDAVGGAVITVEVRDAGADQIFQTADDGIVERKLTVQVASVNDAPTFRLSGNQVVTIGSNQRFVSDFASDFDSGGGADEDAQSVADYLINVDRPELFLVQPAIDIHGTLRYQPNLDTTGVATVRVQVKDNGGTDSGGIDRSSPINFQIAVIDLADGDIDFGDAPDRYPVTIRANGARHRLGPLFLGTAVDAESDGQASPDATGDDARLDDEDGIQWIFPPMASRTQPTQTSLRANVSLAGKVDAWIDFNQDGDWSDTGEQILASATVVAGLNWLPYTVPVGSSVGATYARVRLSSVGGLGYGGLSEDGEVEDYRITVLDAGVSTNSVTLQVSDLPPHETKVLDGQFLLQSQSRTLVSVPVSSLSMITVTAVSGATLYSIVSPGANLKGTIKTNDLLSSVTLLLTSGDLDLRTLGAAAITGVKRLELAGDAAQHLEFTPADLDKLNSIKRLEIVIGSGDTVSGHAPWKLVSREQTAGHLNHSFESSGRQLIAQATSDWVNPLNAYDVNGDGVVSPIDALWIINYINQHAGSSSLPQFDSQLPLEHAFYDVSSSRTIEPLDVLLVINVLNTQVAGEGESEPLLRKRYWESTDDGR